jgi:hypothetical protein
VSGLGWLAGGVVAALLLAGCSGDEPAAEPPPLKAPTTSPVATESPTTPEPPVLPAAARENTKAGAVAFAHHYIDVVNYVRNSGDTRRLRRLGSSTCESCVAIADLAEDIYAEGGSLQGGRWSVTGSSALPGATQHEWQVVTNVRVSEQLFRPRAGAPAERRRAEKTTLLFMVRRASARWVIASLERQTNE